MGQKTNPIGNRLGYIHGWESNWYGGNDYKDKIVEDDQIRKYLNARLTKASISKIIIERTLKLVTVTINTARPGVIIGKGGQEVDKLKEELSQLRTAKVAGGPIAKMVESAPTWGGKLLQVLKTAVGKVPGIGGPLVRAVEEFVGIFIKASKEIKLPTNISRGGKIINVEKGLSSLEKQTLIKLFFTADQIANTTLGELCGSNTPAGA